MPIAIIPSKANRVRALAQSNPAASPEEVAAKLGIQPRAVRIATSKGDKRRVKSVAS